MTAPAIIPGFFDLTVNLTGPSSSLTGAPLVDCVDRNAISKQPGRANRVCSFRVTLAVTRLPFAINTLPSPRMSGAAGESGKG